MNRINRRTVSVPMAIGVSLGLAIGSAMGKIAIGLILGIVVGGIGILINQSRRKKDIIK